MQASAEVYDERLEVEWSHLVPEEDWTLYRTVLDAALARGLRMAIGGGFAFSNYARRWRDTKDLDLYILPTEREAFVDVLTSVGFADYHEKWPYDPTWIYRGHREHVIVDLIWAMANHRTEVDEQWLTRGPAIHLRGLHVQLLPPEEFLWSKLYVIQRDRCDWPDLLNLLHQEASRMDWGHLIERVGPDTRLLGGLLSAFAWTCPAQARAIPLRVWHALGVRSPDEAGDPWAPDCKRDRRRIVLLDSRDWFGANLEPAS